MLKHTPVHSRAATLNQSWDWRRWAGYAVSSKYEMTHDREYYAIRSAAGLIDVSPLYKYRISGPDAERFLSRLLVRDVRRCRVGQAFYTCWCDDDGFVVEDGVLLRLEAQLFHLTAAEPNLAWFTDNAAGFDVVVEDIAEQYAILAVQGPLARDIVQPVTGIDLHKLRYFWAARGTVLQHPGIISRTGYTGDLGYEIWIEAERAPQLWDALLESGADYRLLPAGMLALDMTRIEAGLLLLDADYGSSRFARIRSERSTPLELGFGWMLRGIEDRTRRFIGRDAILREVDAGSTWAFAGVEVDWDSYERHFLAVGLSANINYTPVRASIPLYRDGRFAGYATSSTYSPLLKKHLYLATIAPQFAEAGAPIEVEITVDHRRAHVTGRVVDLPFYNPVWKRA